MEKSEGAADGGIKPLIAVGEESAAEESGVGGFLKLHGFPKGQVDEGGYRFSMFASRAQWCDEGKGKRGMFPGEGTTEKTEEEYSLGGKTMLLQEAKHSISKGWKITFWKGACFFYHGLYEGLEELHTRRDGRERSMWVRTRS